jgi:hypothetical protein
VGQTIKDGNQIIIRYKSIGAINYILHHAPTVLVIDNFSKKVKQLDLIFIEPRNGWNMCIKCCDVRYSTLVDEVILFYS